MTIPVIIPAYEPDEKLIELLDKLNSNNIAPIIIVNDGSIGKRFDEIFESASQRGAVVLKQAVNMGKGRALKTAFNYCLCEYEDMLGCITADSDGQHQIDDIVKCMDAIEKNPDALIMGVRSFTGDVPKKSLFGNRITSYVLKGLTGVYVSDTQTGLRAIPVGFMKKLVKEKGERYEFDTNMLLDTKTQEIPIVEVPIRTIYIEGNSKSHFNAFTDSMRIYALFAKFIFSSLSSSILDVVLFWIVCGLINGASIGPVGYIMIATIIARIFSSFYNFKVNYKIVFKSEKRGSEAMAKYAVLVVIVMLISGGLVTLLHSLTGLPAVAIKIPVDCLLFLMNFGIQREFIY